MTSLGTSLTNRRVLKDSQIVLVLYTTTVPAPVSPVPLNCDDCHSDFTLPFRLISRYRLCVHHRTKVALSSVLIPPRPVWATNDTQTLLHLHEQARRGIRNDDTKFKVQSLLGMGMGRSDTLTDVHGIRITYGN